MFIEIRFDASSGRIICVKMANILRRIRAICELRAYAYLLTLYHTAAVCIGSFPCSYGDALETEMDRLLHDRLAVHRLADLGDSRQLFRTLI